MLIVRYIIDHLILFYAITISIAYLVLALISGITLIKYKRKNRYTDYGVIFTSPFAPAVSIIAPAFNESMSIIQNIRGLLALHYNNFEVIIVNDGSKDNSLEIVIEEYKMEKVDFAVNAQLKTKEIRGIYRSTERCFSNLTLIDKFNGGKADSLNAGINVSRYEYFVAVDVDSIIEPDALLKLVKPLMESRNKKVIAVGGAVRVANSCEIESGEVINVDIPDNLLARFQVLEYTRAFLMGRIAWCRLGGLLIISGALGLFDREIALKSGGYNHNTVGEDMELVVRMRRYMFEHKLAHRIEYIPDPLCWTEVPTTLKILSRQRNRWTRGTMETLFMHSKIFFNPKYKVMGLLGYPFWFFYEWLAPLVEFFGLIYVVLIIVIGQINWPFFYLLLIFVYLFAMAFSTYAILYEELTFHRYNRQAHIFKLLVAAIIEPLIYHPCNVYWALKGNIAYFRGEKGWGAMDRAGFQKKKDPK